ncbi:uncharacterized protein LOC110608824 [Manihot esculenta]|uniref:Uncharacterized protein n=1 Tax=Manihot esculenta TaxID=3983 RepID=A0A2C9WEC1_MANES|nr:uncharacterized protein LOC110608824 [Manihot esculenta]OAY58219.1 hypothetical protein MANES_02G159100v8 [Manihot esculenta]
MGKPEARIHLSNKFSWAKATNSNKSVIISVYVESPRKCSHHKTGDHLTNKAKRNPLFRRPQGAETKCYDRRAELLAYVRQLRDGGARHSRRDSLRLKFEEKKSKLSSAPVRIETSMRRIFRRNERQDRTN